jgi:serine/threonine-protein kinase RsbW
MPPIDAPDEVVLTLPAAPEFVRLARLTCAGLATRIGMGYDEVEDLRIAVGEACSLLIGAGARKGTLTLTFGLDADAVGVTIAGGFDGPGVAADDTGGLSDQILDAVVDEHEVDLAGDRVWISKRHASTSAEEAEPA